LARGVMAAIRPRGHAGLRRLLVLRGALLALLAPAIFLLAPASSCQETSTIVRERKPSLQRLTGDVSIDLSNLSFSRFGSYMVFSKFPQGLFLRELHHNSGRENVIKNALRVEVMDGEQSIPFTENVRPTTLQLVSSAGTVDICFAAPNLIRFRTHGVALRLTSDTPLNYPVQEGPQEWEFHGWSNYRLAALHGNVRVDAKWDGISAAPASAVFLPDAQDKTSEGYIGDYLTEWHEPAAQGYDDAAAGVAAEYRAWIAKFPPVPAAMRATAERAAYLDWSDVVAPAGHLNRPAMLMSKNWMVSVWSWDHCLNAMAMINVDPDFAWDQFMIPFDEQDKDGALPDRMDDFEASFRHTKPPVHGWVLRWMMEHSDSITTDKLQQIYGPLSRWTDWYFKFKDADHDGLPEYNQGDDSGWDNSTIFLSAPPIEAPDLAAFLVVQMDVLSDIATKLGKPDESAKWHERSDALLARMLAAYWKDGQFVARRAFTHEDAPRTSLLLYVPIILGTRLPEPMRSQLIARLFEPGRFLTANGLATEELQSPHYVSGGYWLGPIWAPTVYMIGEGLKEDGRIDLEQDLRSRLCNMISRSGFAENFDAVTGAGSVMPDLDASDHERRDPSYTWTSSVFLLYAQEEAREQGQQNPH
jgi:glycogen debranching enzyme